MSEVTREQKAILAARLLSAWDKSKRNQVVVTESDHDLLLFELAPIRVIVDKEQQKVLYVVHYREKAVSYLMKEYNLYHARHMSIRRDFAEQ